MMLQNVPNVLQLAMHEQLLLMEPVFVHLNKKVYEHGKNSVLMPFANNCVFNSFFVS